MAERVAIFISTPAQFHFYRNIVEGLEKRGVEIRLLFRDYGETLEVVEEYDGFVFSKVRSNWDRIYKLPVDVLRARKHLAGFKPDLVTGFEIYAPYTAKLLGARSFVFYDSEPRVNRLLNLQIRAYLPFVDAILTPSAYLDDLGSKHLRVNAYKELAYLHPKYFTPDRNVLDELGVSENEYAILRFNAFDAAHDVGLKGFGFEEKIRLVKELEKHLDVFISAEGDNIPKELESNVLRVSKKKIHHVLYFARLAVCETGTMSTEAALLGTPAIFIHPRAFAFGVFKELEERYGLLYRFDSENSEDIFEKSLMLVNQKEVKSAWKEKLRKVLREKIDIAEFMVWFVEKYPESLEEFGDNPDLQYSFRWRE
ncbi:Uncharacterized protein conserved in archaea [Geoglobus ahangari]|uniref:Uncharacterized protein conserved in archaea n=1 Tax=Geoglobus ahangari TaxID=113653 RepID=A0A0F7ID63_9EURY|nr:DUF354 domain-containing protein [Geoglobus ahangari]AKG91252.1 Uncharacterized protein conserved in archaea [Geoglobus ahangari]